MSKLCLGTVQFGLKYGVTNNEGQVGLNDAQEILEYAKANNIESLDTARGYGTSEEVLGSLQAASCFKIISKFQKEKPLSLVSQITETLIRLKATSLYGYLCHDADFFLANHKALLPILFELKAKGQIERIGCSVYGPEQVTEILKVFTPDLIQLPANVFDQRFSTSGILDQLHEKEVEVHARSAFLQGALLESVDKLNNYFLKYKKNFFLLEEFASLNGLTHLEVCLLYLIKDPRISKVVVGVCQKKQLQEILGVEEKLSNFKKLDFSKLSCEDVGLILPTKWKLG